MTPSGVKPVITDPALLAAVTGATKKYNEALAVTDDLRIASVAAAEKANTDERKLLDTKRGLQIQDLANQKILLNQEAQQLALENEKRLKEAAGGGGGGEADKKLDEIEKKLQALFDSIKGNIENALMSLNNLIFYGEGSFGEIMGNLFKSIQQDFFKQTIADPVSEALTGKLFSMLDVDQVVSTKGEKGLSYEGKSLLVKVVNAAEIGMGSLLGGGDDKDPEAAKGPMDWLGKLFSKEGPIAKSFSNLFGEGGFLSKLLGGFGSFLGSIFKAIFGGIFGGGMAQGGIVHMAQGGVAGASALRRDRIPTLLEPGEFVVRKPVARMVGTPALNALNATGRMPNGGGAPVININNEGSAKDVQTAQPRFDGDKYVIDIIMRDLSNNGPIRRSLRGGAI
jgi:hypothetical protein